MTPAVREPIPADELARLAALFAAAEWRFAKTMPDNPHEYTLRKTWDEDADFVWAVETIRRYGYREKFRRTYYTLLDVNGYKHWTMGAPLDITILINRKPLGQDDPAELERAR